MITKFLKLISIYSLIFIFKNIFNSNSLAQVDFNEKNISNYFSGLVSLNNNKIVFADIDEKTGLICLDSVKKKIYKKTRAIIPVN